MSNYRLLSLVSLVAGAIVAAAQAPGASYRLTGASKLWHPVAVTFNGPATSEDATPNPFRDYRLNVDFTRRQPGHRVWVLRSRRQGGGDLRQGRQPVARAFHARPSGPSALHCQLPRGHGRGDEPDSPENFLAYEGFDDTVDTDATFNEGRNDTGRPFIHRNEPHARDWRKGDPAAR